MSDLVWAAEHDFLILGTRFRVQVTDAEHGKELSRLLAPFDYGRRTGVRGRHTFSLVADHSPDADGQVTVLAYRDCKRIGLGVDLNAALAVVLATINRTVVDECSDFAIHAGVATIGGVGVAFPAESGGGKSTLTAACLLRGFGYGSDEALVVNERGAVLSYPKQLSLSTWSCDKIGMSDVGARSDLTGPEERFLTNDDLGADLAPPEFPLGHVVLAEFGHEEMALDEAPKHEAMTALLQLSFNHYKDGARAFRLAANLANQVQVWRLRYSDPLAAAATLRQTLSSGMGESDV